MGSENNSSVGNNMEGQPNLNEAYLIFPQNQNPVIEAFLWEGFEPIFYAQHKEELKQPPKDFVEKHEVGNSMFFVSYFLIVLIWSFLYRKNGRDFMGVLKSFVNNNTLLQEFEDSKSSNGLVSITLFLVGIVVLSIYFSQVVDDFTPIVNLGVFGQSVSSILLIGITLVFGLLVKTLVVGLGALVFNSQKILGTYLSLNVISIQMLGILLFPIIVGVSYGIELNAEWVLSVGGVMLSLIFVYRLVRTFFLGVKQTNSQVFHIILYICALEILPLMAIGRVLLDSQV